MEFYGICLSRRFKMNLSNCIGLANSKLLHIKHRIQNSWTSYNKAESFDYHGRNSWQSSKDTASERRNLKKWVIRNIPNKKSSTKRWCKITKNSFLYVSYKRQSKRSLPPIYSRHSQRKQREISNQRRLSTRDTLKEKGKSFWLLSFNDGISRLLLPFTTRKYVFYVNRMYIQNIGLKKG